MLRYRDMRVLGLSGLESIIAAEVQNFALSHAVLGGSQDTTIQDIKTPIYPSCADIQFMLHYMRSQFTVHQRHRRTDRRHARS